MNLENLLREKAICGLNEDKTPKLSGKTIVESKGEIFHRCYYTERLYCSYQLLEGNDVLCMYNILKNKEY